VPVVTVAGNNDTLEIGPGKISGKAQALFLGCCSSGWSSTAADRKGRTVLKLFSGVEWK
jgi:hypothetical protein